MKKRLCALGLAAVMLLGMTACGTDKTLVPVQQVSMLTGAMEASDKYPGVVVSENVTEIKRDSDKAIKEVYVSEGDEVTAGQKLFSYDVEQLSLELDQKKLELERINNDITTSKNRISSLEAQLKKAKDTAEKTSLNLQISTETANKNEAEYNKKVKQKEIDQTQTMLKNVDVTSPVAGRIRKVNNNGEGMELSGAFITIQESGTYRVKGNLNELSAAGGITEGAAVNIISRMDNTVMWSGTVAMIDYEGGSQNNDNNGFGYIGGAVVAEGGNTSMSTNYPFYVELDSSEGLLLGQHVYIEVAGSDGRTGLWIPEHYLFDIQEDPETQSTTAHIWVASEKNKLENCQVTLGEYDEATGDYEVLEGLALVDYVADPNAENCTEGAYVSYRNASDFDIPETDATQDWSDEVDPGVMDPEMGGMNDGNFVEDGSIDENFAIDGVMTDGAE